MEKTHHQALEFLSDEEKKALLGTAEMLQGVNESQKLHPVLKEHSKAFSDWAKEHPRDEYANWKKDYYYSVSMNRYIAAIIDTMNKGETMSFLTKPALKIKYMIENYRKKDQ